MRGEENRVNARNQENLVRDTQRHNTHPSTHSLSSSDRLRPFPDSSSTQANRLVFVSRGRLHTHTHLIVSRTSTATQTHKEAPRTQVETTCWRVGNVEADSPLHSQM